MREETDGLGKLLIQDDVYYGIQTERAKHNFAISGKTIEGFPKLIWSIAAIKKAAALAHRDIGVLEEEIASAILQASEEVMKGEMRSQFPIDVFQGGGGTSTNMNVNEVIANRANEILLGIKGYQRVHPNTHINMGQSTNDVIPSAMKIASYLYLQELLQSMETLEKVLEDKVNEFRDIVKIGRTCFQDAVPITLGQEFSGYLFFLRRQMREIDKVMSLCCQIPLGATAIGTGLGTHPGYLEKVYVYLFQITEIAVRKEENFFDSLQNGDTFLRLSFILKSIATGLSKMASDFRLLSSGPKAGFSEIVLPAVQPGSSIMPGKVNPVIPEMVNQVCYQVCGNDFAITMAVEGGELDLNTWEPLMMKCLDESFRLLTQSITLFANKCVNGIRANKDVCAKFAESSIALSTVISTIFGYETGQSVAKYANEKGILVKTAAIEMGILTPDEADKLLDPMVLTNPEKNNLIF